MTSLLVSLSFRRTENDCKMELKRSASAPAFSTFVGSFYGVGTAQANTQFPQGKCAPDNGKSMNEYLLQSDLDLTVANLLVVIT